MDDFGLEVSDVSPDVVDVSPFLDQLLSLCASVNRELRMECFPLCDL